MYRRSSAILFLSLWASSNLAYAQTAAPEPERNLFARLVEDHPAPTFGAFLLLLFIVGAVAFQAGRSAKD